MDRSRLVHRDLAVDAGIRLDMDQTRDLFFSAADVDFVIAVFEIGEIEDVLKRRFANELVVEDVFVPGDGDMDHVVVRILDSDAELHAIFRYGMDAYFQGEGAFWAVGGLKGGQGKGDKRGKITFAARIVRLSI